MAITNKALQACGKRKSKKLKSLVTRYIADHGGASFGPCPWILPTICGDLQISMHDDAWPTIFSRWDDVDKAVAQLGKFRMNPYSGKWNFHFPGEWTVQEMFDQWTRELKPLQA